MRDFNFKSNSIVIFLYVLENLCPFNKVFFPRCMHFFSQKYVFLLKIFNTIYPVTGAKQFSTPDGDGGGRRRKRNLEYVKSGPVKVHGKSLASEGRYTVK